MIKKVLPIALMGAVSFNVVAAEPNLSGQQQKFSYAIGFQVAQGLKQQGLNVDPDAMAAAIKDVLSGAKLRVSLQEMQGAMDAVRQEQMQAQKTMAEQNLKASQAFMAENKKKPGVKETASGLQYKVVSEGKGAKPKASDKVEVHYRGTLIDGKEFDSSYKRGQPIEFPVSQVIPGWTEGLQMMKTGSKYQLFIPPNLAYGAQGMGSIGPNQALIFEVELLAIK